MPARNTSTDRQPFKQVNPSQRKVPKGARAKRYTSRENAEMDQTLAIAGRNKARESDDGQHRGGAKDKGQNHGPRLGTKLATIIAQMKQKRGTTIEALSKATGWRKHSVHGVISGMIRTKMGITVQTEVKNGVHYYRIAE